MIRVVGYILLLGCVVLSMIPVVRFNQAISGLRLELIIPVLQIFAVIALTHFPAILPVRKQTKYMGVAAKWFGRYPEIPTPFIIWAAWGVGGAKTGQTGMMVLVGAGVAVCLGLAYAAIRVVDALTARAKMQALANPTMNLAPLRTKGARSIYMLRVLLVVGSGIAVIASVALGASTQAVLLLCMSCAGGAVVIAFVVVIQSTWIAKLGAADAARQVKISQQVDPACVAVHYSQPAKSKHLAPKELCTMLRLEGLKTAVILRETNVQKAFEAAEADYVWPAPTIGHLDAYALDTIRAVFYTNDAIKNGHFTRFNQLTHVLVAKANGLATAATLPSGLAIYDAVVAPNLLTAEKWRVSANPEIAQRIVTVGKLSINAMLLPAIRRCPDNPIISVHIRPESLEKETFGILMDGLLAVFADVSASPALALTLSYTQEKPSRFLDLIVTEFTRQAAAVNNANPDEPKRIFIREGRPEPFHNAADVLIATNSDDVAQMVASQKIVLWLGQGTPPLDVPAIAKDRPPFSQQLEGMIESAVTPSFALPSVPQHYTSYCDLIEHLESARQLQGTHVK